MGKPAKDYKEVKQRLKKRVAEILATNGAALDIAALRAEFPDMPKQSFYRWMNQVRKAPPDPKAIKNIKRRIKKRSKETGISIMENGGVNHVIAQSPDPMKAIDVLFEVSKSLKGADDVERKGRNKKGEITLLGADLVLGAARERTRAVGVLAKIQLDMLDAERVRAYHAHMFRVILTRLAGADKALAMLVVEDIRAVNKHWGMEFHV